MVKNAKIDDNLNIGVKKKINKKNEILDKILNKFDLPTKIDDKYLNNEYNGVKEELINRNIELTDILSIKNINITEKTNLIEQLIILNSCDDVDMYLKIRNNIHNVINKKMIEDEFSDKKQILNDINCCDDTEKKILNLCLPMYENALIYNKYKKLISMTNNDNEYSKLKEYIETVIKIPFNKIFNFFAINQININKYLCNVKKKLDDELYGMTNIKEELLLIINQRLNNLNTCNNNIALVGPPGIGKTKIILTLCSILGIPYEQISMGGINDASYLGGHSYTYEGAKSGKIVDSLIKMKCMNGIIFFDEIDKIGKSLGGIEVTNQLIHITDSTQNHNFVDKYISDIPIDLTKIWFIFSLNNPNDINDILKNRLNFIYLNGYSYIDKLNMTKDYLLPNYFNIFNLKNEDYILSDDVLMYIINKLNKEPGIRDLKRGIEKIFVRLKMIDTILNDKSNNKSNNKLNNNLNLLFLNKDMKNKPYQICKNDIDLFLN